MVVVGAAFLGVDKPRQAVHFNDMRRESHNHRRTQHNPNTINGEVNKSLLWQTVDCLRGPHPQMPHRLIMNILQLGLKV